uniref:Glutamate/phenylalanine/leucine/valine/L-tryptophan dehydrogenase C-terminal domain-containing protein n=1 Tax=Corethron hystrix TaxID=216773 RepID=A0A6U5DND6_9STRA
MVARCLYLREFDIVRAYLDVVSDGENGSVSLLRGLVWPPKSATTETDICRATVQLERNIKSIKWLDPFALDLVLERYPFLGTRKAEIISAFGSLMHPIMAKVDSAVYTKANIHNFITERRYVGHAAEIAELFMDRFNPEAPMSDEMLKEKVNKITEDIDREVEDLTASILLKKMLDIIIHTKKTNLFMRNRYALGMRLDPKIMNAKNDGDAVGELPFGVFFVHGRRFDAFHVRFRDIARGGMRLVTPASSEQLAMEAARHYEECYGLAYAQQLKNKDIPEGGSKAVCLIDSVELSPDGKYFTMRKCVKAFADTLLDLIVDTNETQNCIVNHLSLPEVLYLGPDEQVIPDDINWIVQRAAMRGYQTPPAFMSSKPLSGINHKEFGVTSEGVNVYLQVALQNSGIDPKKQPFSVKITGGPDGDVAGNLIKIMFRDYGENVRIVGVADHSGCVEDPNGLDHDEMMRLVTESLSISHYDEHKLSGEGNFYGIEDDFGMRMRNTMHNRLEADAFIPAGGRPSTINMSNWKNFLKDDGTPSSRLIVEGANLFITEDARQSLFDEGGVVIVKDSSANKCGVITSSFEICAAMLLDEDEFLLNKDAIVSEVLVKLRELARLEAELLFREIPFHPGISLPQTSQLVSAAMNMAKDAIIAALDSMSLEERECFLPLFLGHLPPTMAELAHDRISDRVPTNYVKSAIASCLASKLVYKEGTQFITNLPKAILADTALKYLQKEKDIALLSQALADSNVPDSEKQEILELLKVGGVRISLDVHG